MRRSGRRRSVHFRYPGEDFLTAASSLDRLIAPSPHRQQREPLVNLGLIPIAVIVLIVLVVFFASLRLCQEWERKVVLRLGNFAGVRGPGVFFLLPFVEQTPFTVDMRVVTRSFKA